MLKWIISTESGSVGLQRMRSEFLQMLEAGEQVFNDAIEAFLGNTSISDVRERVFKTDKLVNKAERNIRKEIVVHESVHQHVDFVQCLVLMSIVKDAERLGDYGKNFFDLAEMRPEVPSGTDLERITVLKDELQALFQGCRNVLQSGDEVQAKEILCSATALEDQCDEIINRFVRLEEDGGQMVATYVLTYRYFKRIASHLRNITSSVVQPVHKLDFTSKITGRPESKE